MNLSKMEKIFNITKTVKLKKTANFEAEVEIPNTLQKVFKITKMKSNWKSKNDHGLNQISEELNVENRGIVSYNTTYLSKIYQIIKCGNPRRNSPNILSQNSLKTCPPESDFKISESKEERNGDSGRVMTGS